ncbi:MAG: hypothetical protein ACTH02_09520 [Corynebacterium sp.]
MTISLLSSGRLAMDADYRTRVATAAHMHGLTLTEDLLYAVIQADGVGNAAVTIPATDTHPAGVDSTPITDAAILAAVAAYTPEDPQ